MAIRQDIIAVIDAFLENTITLDEAVKWAEKEISKTHPCDDPAFTLLTFLGSDVPEEVMVRPLREQLLLDREVLVRGVPCPQKELGKTIEAFWLAFTPWEKIVLCQIRITECGERILEVIEEGWDGTQLFHEETPLPLKDGNEPLLTWEKIQKKRTLHRFGLMTTKRYLRWVIDQMQRKSAVGEYQHLLPIYWKLHRPKAVFSPEYSEGKNKSGNLPPALEKLVEFVRKLEEEREKEEEISNKED